MKKNFTLFALFLLFNFSLFAQGKIVNFHINHLLNGIPFTTKVIAKDPGNTYFFHATTLRYYISKIKITHDGGKVTDVPNLYILVNAEIDKNINLGTFDITNIEGVEFGIGVDKDANHLDPTTYAKDHALAMQNPTMHWGWTAGYRFVAIEGFAGTTSANLATNYQIHTLDDKLYKTVKVATKGKTINGQLTIDLNADYVNMMKNINLKNGVISHGSTGASLTLTNNMAASVFTAANSVGVEDLFTLDVKAYPNPATGQVTIKAPINSIDNQEVTITNAVGQIVLKQQKNNETLQLPLSLSAGNYMILIAENGKTIGREKLVIVE